MVGNAEEIISEKKVEKPQEKGESDILSEIMGEVK
jgi:hypothetical protein